MIVYNNLGIRYSALLRSVVRFIPFYFLEYFRLISQTCSRTPHRTLFLPPSSLPRFHIHLTTLALTSNTPFTFFVLYTLKISPNSRDIVSLSFSALTLVFIRSSAALVCGHLFSPMPHPHIGLCGTFNTSNPFPLPVAFSLSSLDTQNMSLIRLFDPG